MGAQKERLAAEYLKARGVTILEQNFRCRQGEIDLIARDGEYLVFCEVKFRLGTEMGSPEEAVGIAKQKKICRVGDYYRSVHGLKQSTPVRYDVIAIRGENVSWIRNAFPHQYR